MHLFFSLIQVNIYAFSPVLSSIPSLDKILSFSWTRLTSFSCFYVSCLPEALKENSSEVVQPFLMGCGTKEPKITQLCLAAIQRLMSHEVVSEVRRHTLLHLFVSKKAQFRLGRVSLFSCGHLKVHSGSVVTKYIQQWRGSTMTGLSTVTHVSCKECFQIGRFRNYLFYRFYSNLYGWVIFWTWPDWGRGREWERE